MHLKSSLVFVTLTSYLVTCTANMIGLATANHDFSPLTGSEDTPTMEDDMSYPYEEEFRFPENDYQQNPYQQAYDFPPMYDFDPMESAYRTHDCPKKCMCIEKKDEFVTDCSGQNLTSVPEGISPRTTNL